MLNTQHSLAWHAVSLVLALAEATCKGKLGV
jgi:hypothetical protein